MKKKVIDHIENVRDWLERAELEYQNGQTWQGELNLNLAQAELKKAWEESVKLHSEELPITLSSHQAQTKTRTKVEKTRIKQFRQHRYGMVAAVVLLVFVGLNPLLDLNILGRKESVSFLETEGDQGLSAMVTMVANEQPFSDSSLQQGDSQAGTTTRGVQNSPINQTTYTQVALQFDVKKEQLIINQPKEVTREPVNLPGPVFNTYEQLAFEERKLTTISTDRDLSFSVQGFDSNRRSSNEVSTINYDVDKLVDLAKQALHTTR